MKCPVCGNELEVVKNLRNRSRVQLDLAHCESCDNNFHVLTSKRGWHDAIIKRLPREDGYDDEGYDKEGYDIWDYNRERINKETGTPFDTDGFDADDYDENGYDYFGFDRNLNYVDTGTKYDEN